MFLILAREEIQNLKSSLVVWSRALRFPNRQQTVKRPKHTGKKKKKLKKKSSEEKYIRISNAKECAENWLFLRLTQLVKASMEDEELFLVDRCFRVLSKRKQEIPKELLFWFWQILGTDL